MSIKNRYELVKQIESYGLKNKLAEVAKRSESRRPFKHLPKQFSKVIFITIFRKSIVFLGKIKTDLTIDFKTRVQNQMFKTN